MFTLKYVITLSLIVVYHHYDMMIIVDTSYLNIIYFNILDTPTILLPRTYITPHILLKPHTPLTLNTSRI